jgi:hypothetical protein
MQQMHVHWKSTVQKARPIPVKGYSQNVRRSRLTKNILKGGGIYNDDHNNADNTFMTISYDSKYSDTVGNRD